MPKTSKTIALCILGIMFLLLFGSAWNDSATFDEVAHIPAGYSYLTLQDYRINPEHPPLAKILSGLPLLLIDLNFPINNSEWTSKTADGQWIKRTSGNITDQQWDMGKMFLYRSGNNPDKILHFSRFATMLLALFFGWFLFKWVSGFYGYKVGLLTLFFYAFSPTIIAHSRYVTTDIGAAFGVFIATASFVNFLLKPTNKNLLISGLAFGVAQLFKFSLVTLAPFFFVLTILWAFLNKEEGGFWKLAFKFTGKLILIGLVSIAVIWITYAYFSWNYPAEYQIYTTKAVVGHFGKPVFTKISTWMAGNSLTKPLGKYLFSGPILNPFVNLSIWMAGKPFFKPLGEYLFGLLMMTQRADGGNSAYFQGFVSSQGTPIYFPTLYLVKESLIFHIFTLIAIFFSLYNLTKNKRGDFKAVIEWMRDNFALTAGIIFITYYTTMSIKGNLNIGVRHILPILPFIYLLVARQIIRWAKNSDPENPQSTLQWVHCIYPSYIKPLKNYSLVFALSFLMFATTVLSAPNYLSYYNILGGGTMEGYKIATDSNYDWGQDLKRLAAYTEENHIDKIAVDYFGGGYPEYYLENKFVPWWSSKGSPIDQPDAPKWLAVSINTYQGAIAKPRGDFHREEHDNYSWLKDKEPVGRAGASILIYKMK